MFGEEGMEVASEGKYNLGAAKLIGEVKAAERTTWREVESAQGL